MDTLSLFPGHASVHPGKEQQWAASERAVRVNDIACRASHSCKI